MPDVSEDDPLEAIQRSILDEKARLAALREAVQDASRRGDVRGFNQTQELIKVAEGYLVSLEETRRAIIQARLITERM